MAPVYSSWKWRTCDEKQIGLQLIGNFPRVWDFPKYFLTRILHPRQIMQETPSSHLSHHQPTGHQGHLVEFSPIELPKKVAKRSKRGKRINRYEMNLQEIRPQIFVPMTFLLIILMVWWDCLMTNNWGCGCWDEWRGSSWLNGELIKFNLLPFWKTFSHEHAPSNDNCCICLFLASAAVDTVGLGGVITEKVLVPGLCVLPHDHEYVFILVCNTLYAGWNHLYVLKWHGS